MKRKINFEGLTEVLSENEMKNVKGRWQVPYGVCCYVTQFNVGAMGSWGATYDCSGGSCFWHDQTTCGPNQICMGI